MGGCISRSCLLQAGALVGGVHARNFGLRPYAIKTIVQTGLTVKGECTIIFTMHPYNVRLQAEAAKRRAKIQRLKDSGLTYEQVAGKLGLTKQRVHQILKPELYK